MAQWQTQRVLHLEATMILQTVHQGLRLLHPHKYQSTQSKILCIYLSCSQSQEGDSVVYVPFPIFRPLKLP